MRLAPLIFVASLLPGMLPAQDTALERAARVGHQAFRDREYTTAVYFLTDVVTADPKHPSAWKDLCLAYLALDRLDAAIDACRKQIDGHPETKYVYGALGQALWKNGERDEAISAYRRQIELDPRDVSAYGNLGRIYCELGRYAEAVPLLEKALAMVPNYDIGQASLGDAHLGLGHIEQGLAILNKLAHDQDRPDALNRVADILVSHRVGLDLAQQYAESAVTATSGELQRRAEQPVSTDTLRLVVSLATYWDTLGRVHRQRGNPDVADKFIAAAQQQRAIGASAIPVGKLFAEKAAAEFYVAQAQKPAVATAQFIRGDERLRPFTNAVQDAVPPVVFPQAIPAKIARRVNLTCPGQGGDCSIELLSASAALDAELNAMAVNTRFANDLPASPGSLRGPRGNRSNVTYPVPIYRPEPEYSEEARKNGLEGTVILHAEVDLDGLPHNIKVVRALGMGLDEKAIEAVSQWRFRPGAKDGKPDTVAVTIEVNFRLMKRPPGQ